MKLDTKSIKDNIEVGCIDPFMLRNLINHYGVSLMYRPMTPRGGGYYHAQVGAEEPENETLSTHKRFDIAVCLCILKKEGEMVFAEKIEARDGR